MKRIILKNLTIGYGRNVVAKGINGCLYSGEMVCLIGSNGVGKSTLLRTMGALQKRISGDIFLSGDCNSGCNEFRSIDDCSPKKLSKFISVVLTEKVDLLNITVEELVGMGRQPYTGFWGNLSCDDKKIVAESLDAVGISCMAKCKVLELSDGECQKVMIAKALAQNTPIIILDEPTAYLDFHSKVEMLQLLNRLAHKFNKTVFLSIHDLELALQITDKIWLMNHDSLIIGTPKELSASGELSRYVDCEEIRLNMATLHVDLR